MLIQNFTFENTKPSVQRRVYTNGASNIFYGTFTVLENGEPFNGLVAITKNGVEVEPEEGTDRYSLCKLATDPDFNTFELRSHGAVHKLIIEYVENGTAITDEGDSGGTATGVQKVNGLEPDSEGNVLVQEVFGREDPTKSIDGDDMIEAIDRIRALEAAKTYISSEVDDVKIDVDGLKSISADHEQRISALEETSLTGDYVPLSGGMMTGALSVAGSGTQVVEIDGTYVTIRDGGGMMRQSWENIIDAGQYDPGAGGKLQDEWNSEHFTATATSEGTYEYDGEEETAQGAVAVRGFVNADGYGTTMSTSRLEAQTVPDGDGYLTTSKVVVATASGGDDETPEVKSSVTIEASMHDEAGHNNVSATAKIEVEGVADDGLGRVGDYKAEIKPSSIQTMDKSPGGSYAYLGGGGVLELLGKGEEEGRTNELFIDTRYDDGPHIDIVHNEGGGVPSFNCTLTMPQRDGRLAVIGEVGAAPTPKALPEYLYELDFASSYKTYGDEWRAQHFNDIDMGGCTGRSFSEGVKRWYDWKYDDSAAFVVKMPHRMNDEGEELYASIGVASLGSFLTKQMVASGQYTEIYKALPGMTQDGMNEFGVYAQINVVKSDPTKDEGWTGEELDVLGAVRYVLDHFDKGSDAADWIASSCYLPSGFVESTGYSVMFLVRGKDDEGDEGVWIVQDGIVHKSSEGLVGVATNFRLYDPDGNMHWTREEVAQYDPYGSGLERWQVAGQASWDEDTDAVNFTKAYTDNAYGTDSPWYSDFVGGDLDLNSPDEDFEDVMDAAKEAYENRTRDGQTWQTVHFCKYDLENKTLTVRVQEGTEDTVFLMPTAGGSGEAVWGAIGGDIADQEDLQEALQQIPTQTAVLSGTYIDGTTFNFNVYIRE